MANISPVTKTIDWTVGTASTTAITTGSGVGLIDDLVCSFWFLDDGAVEATLGGSASGLTADATAGTEASGDYGTYLSLPATHSGVTLSDTSALKFTGDFTVAFLIRKTAGEFGTIVADWDSSGGDTNYAVTITSSGGVFILSSDNVSSDSAIIASVVADDTWTLVVAQRDGTKARVWAFADGDSFTYDPGGYDPEADTGDNFGETQIGVAPDDDPTSWEPLLDEDITYSGSSTTNDSILFTFSNDDSDWPGDISLFSAWNRALSYQEIASLAFDPWRMFRDPNIDTADVDEAALEGIDRYIAAEVGPAVVFGVDAGGNGGEEPDLPTSVSAIGSSLITRGTWISQSWLNAPGIANFRPQMGYNPTDGPADQYIATDDLSINPSGLRDGYRHVSMVEGALDIIESSVLSDRISEPKYKAVVFDIENVVTSDSVNVKLEVPNGYYGYLFYEEVGKRIPDIPKNSDQEIMVWFRPQSLVESTSDLTEKGNWLYLQNADAVVVPFYYDYNTFTNTGTDAKTRIDYALANNHGGFPRRIQYTHHIAKTFGIKVLPAVRIDSVGNYATQSVFDSQMELCMRVADGIEEHFGGIYLWGDNNAYSVAGTMLSYWANQGEAMGLYDVNTPSNITRLEAKGIYEDLSEIYGNAASSINSSVTSLYNALVLVAQLEDPDVKIELLDTFESVYNSQRIGATRPLLSSTAKLNAFIVRRTQYNSVNEFLNAVGLQVSSDWADISADAGTPIDAIYVKD